MCSRNASLVFHLLGLSPRIRLLSQTVCPILVINKPGTLFYMKTCSFYPINLQVVLGTKDVSILNDHRGFSLGACRNRSTAIGLSPSFRCEIKGRDSKPPAQIPSPSLLHIFRSRHTGISSIEDLRYQTIHLRIAGYRSSRLSFFQASSPRFLYRPHHGKSRLLKVALIGTCTYLVAKRLFQ